MMFVTLRIFEQTCPSAKELLLHYLDDFVSLSGWTHAGFQRFLVKPSPYARAVFLRRGLPSRCVFATTKFVILWPNTFWPPVIRCDASISIYVCAVFLQQRQILLAYLDKHILTSSNSLRSLHLFSCYASATRPSLFMG